MQNNLNLLTLQLEKKKKNSNREMTYSSDCNEPLSECAVCNYNNLRLKACDDDDLVVSFLRFF